MRLPQRRPEAQLLWCHDNSNSQALGQEHWSEEVMRADLRPRRRPTTSPCSILHGSFAISSGQRIDKHPVAATRLCSLLLFPQAFSVGAG
jgi:hypothetical protein